MIKILTYPPAIRILSLVLLLCFLLELATDSAVWQDVFESEKLELSETQSEDKTEIDEVFSFNRLFCFAISKKNNTILLTYAKAFYAGEMREILTPPPQLSA